jgi:hypothetical protein
MALIEKPAMGVPEACKAVMHSIRALSVYANTVFVLGGSKDQAAAAMQAASGPGQALQSPQQRKMQQHGPQQQQRRPQQQGQQQQQRHKPGGGPAGRQSSGGGTAKHQQQRDGRQQGVGGAAAAPPPPAEPAAPPMPEHMASFLETCECLLPLRPLEDPLRQKAVAMLGTVLSPLPAALSPYAAAHELEQALFDKHGNIGAGQGMYTRHLLMLWCVLGGPELEGAAKAAADAAKAAAAAERAQTDAKAAPAGSAAAVEAAAARERAQVAAQAAADARAACEGQPGLKDGAWLKVALLDGRVSARELFEQTFTSLGFDEHRDR